jgi:predicted GNAT family acetyltransferase
MDGKTMEIPTLPIEPVVIHNTQTSRFEIEVEGVTAVLEYSLKDKTIVFTHTGVPDAIGGRGVGSKLAHAGLEYARQQELRVIPLCWFVAGFIERHPEYQELLQKG